MDIIQGIISYWASIQAFLQFVVMQYFIGLVLLLTTGLLLVVLVMNSNRIGLIIAGVVPAQPKISEERKGAQLARAWAPHVAQFIGFVLLVNFVWFSMPFDIRQLLIQGDLFGAWAIAGQSKDMLFYTVTYLMGAYLVLRIPTLLGLPSLRTEVIRSLQTQQNG